jgi:hypothetical protein
VRDDRLCFKSIYLSVRTLTRLSTGLAECARCAPECRAPSTDMHPYGKPENDGMRPGCPKYHEEYLPSFCEARRGEVTRR